MPSDLDPKKETVRHSKGQKKKKIVKSTRRLFFFFLQDMVFLIFFISCIFLEKYAFSGYGSYMKKYSP